MNDIKVANRELEIYDNSYIKFSLIEILRYKEVLKNSIPNYIEESRILKNVDFDLYNIEMDFEKYIGIIDSIKYKVKFNDYISDEEHSIVRVEDCSSNHLVVKVKNSEDIRGTFYEIDYCQLNIHGYLLYSSCGITNEFFEKAKKHAKDLAKNYTLREGIIKASKNASGKYTTQNICKNDYDEAYEDFLKKILGSFKMTKQQIEKNLSKVKKLEI